MNSVPYPIQVLLKDGAYDYRFIHADNPSEAIEQALQDCREACLQPAEGELLTQDYIELLEERVADLEACVGEMLDNVATFETERGFTAVYQSDLLQIAQHYEVAP